MGYRIISIIFILAITLKNVYSKDFIYISPLESKFIPAFQTNELGRISLQLILKTDKYEVLFNKIPKNKNEVEFETPNPPKLITLGFKSKKVERTRNDSYFDVEYYLYDENSQKKIKRVLRKKILGRRFLFESRLALYELFFGKDFLEKNKDKIIKEANEDKVSESPPIDPLPTLDEKILNPAQPPSPNDQAKNYQEKIAYLKDDIDRSLKKNRKKKKGKADPPAQTPKRDNSNSKLESDFPEGENPFRIEKELEYSIGYEYQSIVATKKISSIDISVKSDYELVPFYARIYSHLPGDLSNLLFIGLGFKKVIASDSFSIKTPYNINLGFKKVFKSGFALQIMTDYTSQDYILLKTASEGLTTTNIKNFVYDLQLEKRFMLFSKIASLSFNYANSLVSETDVYQDSSLKNSLRSSLYSINAEYNLTGSLYFKVSYQYLNYYSDTVNDLTLESNNLLFAMTYR